jgi:hypothetical protein
VKARLQTVRVEDDGVSREVSENEVREPSGEAERNRMPGVWAIVGMAISSAALGGIRWRRQALLNVLIGQGFEECDDVVHLL